MEQPLTSRGFRLLTLGLVITLLLTLTTVAYSAYENIAYLFEASGGGEVMPQLNVNGTHLTVSNLTLNNRGLYPLSVALRGWVMIGDVELGSASTGEIMITPKTQKRINLILPINLTKAYTDYNLLKTILFNKTVAAFKVKVDFGFQPFIAASFEGALAVGWALRWMA